MGKMCDDCKCCPAVIAAGNDWVCWECDAGEMCRSKIAAIAANVARVKVDNYQARTAAAKEERVSVESERKGRRNEPISEEVRTAILAADPSVPHAELARQFGVSDVSIFTIRKRAGIKLAKAPKTKAANTKPIRAKPAKKHGRPPGLAHAIILPRRTNGLPASLRQVTVCVSEQMLDAWWAAQDLDKKAELFAENYAGTRCAVRELVAGAAS